MKYDYPQFGCYGDSANGQDYNDRKALRFALGYGWQDEDASRILETEDLSEHDSEILAEVVDSAIDYLNTLEDRPFMYWGFEDGNFGLWVNVDGAREDCGFVSSRKQEYPEDDYQGEWLHVSDHGNATLYVRENGKDREIWSVV